MRALAATLILSCSLLGQVPASAFDPLNPNFNIGNEGKVTIFHLGPYLVPPARMVGPTLVPGNFEPLTPLMTPDPGDVYMTGFDSRIVDDNRVQQDPDLLYLHHAVLLKVGARDMTCPLIQGERFAAAGAERIPFSLPAGHGYRIRGPIERVACLLHIWNFSLSPKTVYYQYSMTLVPGNVTPQLREVRPLWLDVQDGGCRGISNYVVPQGTGLDIKSADFTVPANLAILTMGPHLHCGGVKLELINKTTNTLIDTFINRQLCPVDMQGKLAVPPIQLTTNTQVTLRATSSGTRRSSSTRWGSCSPTSAFSRKASVASRAALAPAHANSASAEETADRTPQAPHSGLPRRRGLVYPSAPFPPTAPGVNRPCAPWLRS